MRTNRCSVMYNRIALYLWFYFWCRGPLFPGPGRKCFRKEDCQSQKKQQPPRHVVSLMSVVVNRITRRCTPAIFIRLLLTGKTKVPSRYETGDFGSGSDFGPIAGDRCHDQPVPSAHLAQDRCVSRRPCANVQLFRQDNCSLICNRGHEGKCEKQTNQNLFHLLSDCADIFVPMLGKGLTLTVVFTGQSLVRICQMSSKQPGKRQALSAWCQQQRSTIADAW